MQPVSDNRLLTSDVVPDGPHDFGARINELGNKSTQLLLFLTFAILGAVTLMTKDCAGQERLVRDRRWYRYLVYAKCVLLWTSVILSSVGAMQFLRAVN